MFILNKKRGRPRKFENAHTSIIEQKKFELFGNNISNNKSEYESLINLAYQTGKINQKEFELACLLEKQYNLKSQYLEVKTMPKNSPNTWNAKLKRVMNLKQTEQAFKTWNNIENLIKQHNPRIAKQFIKLIASHHSHEELLILKMNQSIMDILKTGLKTLISLIDLGYSL